MEPYYSCISRLFPKARIVITHFHYARQVVWALENTRKRVQKTLSKENRIYFKNFKRLMIRNSSYLSVDNHNKLGIIFRLKPELDEAYNLKENFYYFFQSKNYQEVSLRLKGWLDQVKKIEIK